MYKTYLNSWWAAHDLDNITNPAGTRLERGRLVEDSENLITKWLEYLENEGVEELPMPEGMSIPHHQVNGHFFGKSKTKLGLLQCADGTLVKPCQPTSRGHKEMEFYRMVFDPVQTNETIVALRSFIPQYYGPWTTELHPGVTYMKLEDITANMNNVSILDVKIGCITYDPDASPEKKEREISKYEYAEQVGFRLSGMRVLSLDNMKYESLPKRVLRGFNIEALLTHGFPFYFNPCGEFRGDYIMSFVRKLLKISAWFGSQTKFAFYASSILFAYDPTKMVGREEPCVNCRKIFNKFAETNYQMVNECLAEASVASKSSLFDLPNQVGEDTSEDQCAVGALTSGSGNNLEDSFEAIKNSFKMVLEYICAVKKARDGLKKSNDDFQSAIGSIKFTLDLFEETLDTVKEETLDTAQIAQIQNHIRQSIAVIEEKNAENEQKCDGIEESHIAFIKLSDLLQKNLNEFHKLVKKNEDELVDSSFEVEQYCKQMEEAAKMPTITPDALLAASEDTREKLAKSFLAVAESHDAAKRLFCASIDTHTAIEQSLMLIAKSEANAIVAGRSKDEEGNGGQANIQEETSGSQVGYTVDEPVAVDEPPAGNESPQYLSMEGANPNNSDTRTNTSPTKPLSQTPSAAHSNASAPNENDNNCNTPGIYSYGGLRDLYSIVKNDHYLMESFMEDCPDCDPLTQVKMIDFVHVFPTSTTDENYRFGLGSLISYLLNLLVLYIMKNDGEKVDPQKLMTLSLRTERMKHKEHKDTVVKEIPENVKLVPNESNPEDTGKATTFVQSEPEELMKDKAKIDSVKSYPEKVGPNFPDEGIEYETNNVDNIEG